MKKLSTLFLACGLSVAAHAQIPITAASPVYTQDFNSLDTAATNSSNLPTGWKIAEAGTSSSANDQYRSGSGSANAGDTYSFGAVQNTDRALGALASNSLQSHFGAAFVNNTGSTLGSMTVSYRCEQWRAGDTVQRPDSLRFFYSVTATDIDTTLNGWTEVIALMGTTTQLQGNGPLDGNSVFNVVSGTVNVSIPNGAPLRIKWVDRNITGSDDGLAVDSLTVSFTPTVPNLRPVISSLTPADGATGVSPTLTSMQMMFNKPVTKGTGMIRLINAGTSAVQMFDVTSSNVTVSGGTVTISGAALATNSNYYVQVDSTAFDSSGYRFVGIYDQTTWNFMTSTVGVYDAMSAKLRLSILGRATADRIVTGFTAGKTEDYTFALYALNGREVARTTVRAAAGENKVVLSPGGLAAGQYILRVSSAGGVGSVKVTVE